MTADRATTAADVAAAQAGDEAALDRIVTAFLPLVYRLIGQQLDGHVDVDDVVQETMVRVVHRLDTLRDPSCFPSWLVAVAMNEVRRRWSRRQPVLAHEPDDRLADPDADFVDVTLLRLCMLDARREFAEATRWLDPDDRHLLALWQRENDGDLTRPDVARILKISLHHAGVRIHRLKARLTTSRAVVHALAAQPGCPDLATATTDRGGASTPLWRNRIARHIRSCAFCYGHQGDLMPVEVLLADEVLYGAAPPAALQGRATADRPLTPLPRTSARRSGRGPLQDQLPGPCPGVPRPRSPYPHVERAAAPGVARARELRAVGPWLAGDQPWSDRPEFRSWPRTREASIQAGPGT
ncbi:sigma-70 family RNA polymerase sigma factor [Kitasatospora sp. NPDC088346]|uniref:sigma-70 family RNA polymerase sigma factor n=1 Tax=Kitasatospora sp. NPDC088346 TaxID=3364073 RepID=UPI003803D9EB